MLSITRRINVNAIRNAAVLPELPYQYHELEPYISADIMELHHSKHHQTYGNFVIYCINSTFSKKSTT